MQTSKQSAGKTLLIVRHAKSSWDIGTLNDFDRPLNERGEKDAPAMAQRLLDKKIKIDAFVASPAKRAKKTAELFCKTYNCKENELILVSALYHPSPQAFYSVIENLDDAFSSVAIFSHNPGITEFATILTNDASIDNMPTCSVFAVTIDISSWKAFKDAEKKFLFFEQPKVS